MFLRLCEVEQRSVSTLMFYSQISPKVFMLFHRETFIKRVFSMYFVVGNILNQEQRCLLNEHESQETSLQLKAVWSTEYETKPWRHIPNHTWATQNAGFDGLFREFRQNKPGTDLREKCPVNTEECTRQVLLVPWPWTSKLLESMCVKSHMASISALKVLRRSLPLSHDTFRSH